jgi:hypothetical protein
VFLVKLKSFFQKHKGAELRSVVFNVHSVFLVFDNRMAPGHRDVIDSDFALVAPAHVETHFLRRKVEHVNGPGGVLL